MFGQSYLLVSTIEHYSKGANKPTATTSELRVVGNCFDLTNNHKLQRGYIPGMKIYEILNH
jgi:hypothetical protein